MSRKLAKIAAITGDNSGSKADEQRLKVIANRIPLGRVGTHDEIAKAVVFLASGGSSYMTGAEIFVEGGRAHV